MIRLVCPQVVSDSDGGVKLNGVSVSPSGRYLASVGEDFLVKVRTPLLLLLYWYSLDL